MCMCEGGCGCDSVDTWSPFTPTHQVQTSCINNTGLSSPSEVHLQCHFKKHEGRVNTVLIELQQLSKMSNPPLSCERGKENQR